jgi:hypothetical protein
MRINKAKFNNVVMDAMKATNDLKWLRAIERAHAGILSGELIVTIIGDDHALVTGANGSYWVNGSCQCRAAQVGHRECRHRAAARLWEIYESAPAREPRITRSIEQDYKGNRVHVVRYDGWMV